jgi:hypothetical protein
MRDRELRRIRATAYHEAGHAVIAWHFHLRFKHVTINPGSDSLGHVLLGHPKWFRPDIASSDRIRIHAERHIIVDLAGQIAEEKFLGKRPRYGMQSDNQNAVGLAFRIGGSEETVDAYLKYCWCAARDCVNVRWKEIESVAAAVVDGETLNYDDCLECICPGSSNLNAVLMRAVIGSRAKEQAQPAADVMNRE